MITCIEGRAFKGLGGFSIKPKNINLIIGANGTGKTNFADFVEFVSLSARYGLKEAFGLMGGFENVRTKTVGAGRWPIMYARVVLGADLQRGIQSVDYAFKLSPTKDRIRVHEESLDATILARKRGKPTPPAKVNFDKARPIKVRLRRKQDKIVGWKVEGTESEPEKVPTDFEDFENLVLHTYGKLTNLRTISDYLGSMRVYNIDEVLAKTGSPNGSEADLQRDGSNLVPFLKRILENTDLKQKLLGSLRDAVPYIKNVEPERAFGVSTLKFEELDSGLEFLAQQMSDGTIRLLGLLALLEQSVPPPVIVIEEPENALHSYAVETFLRVCRLNSVAEKFSAQVFLTSHSPAVVDEVFKIESQKEAPTGGFVARRLDGSGTINAAPPSVMLGIAKNLGRPSDFLREGSFEDGPNHQLRLADSEGNQLGLFSLSKEMATRKHSRYCFKEALA
jgi:predicted ATPase